MTASSLISSHLNAPFGDVLRESDVLDSLKNGRLSGKSDQANAVLGGMFVEVEPRLIARCALEAHVTLQQANLLYLEYLDTLAHAFPKCAQWEASVELLI
jgi:hypothetical protein